MKVDQINVEEIKDVNTFDNLTSIFGVSKRTIHRWIQQGKFPDAGNNVWSRRTLELYVECLQVPTKNVKMCAENMLGR